MYSIDIRETQEAAIQLFKSKGYNNGDLILTYAIVEGKTISGLYFYKNIYEIYSSNRS